MTISRHITFAALTACLLTSLTAQAESPNTKSPSTQQADLTVVDLNTATEAELVKLPNVGASRAAAIVKMRTRLGGFENVEQLMRVRGIGRKTFRTMQPMITVDKTKKSKGSGAHK